MFIVFPSVAGPVGNICLDNFKAWNVGNIALTFVFLSTEQKENCSRSTVKCNENKVKSFYTWHPKIIVWDVKQ